MFGSARNPLPEHLTPHRLRRRYLATSVARRRLVRQSLSIVAASVVGIGVATTVREADAVRDSWGESHPVVLTADVIDVGDRIRVEDLRVELVPVALIPQDAVIATAHTATDGGPVVPPAIIGLRATTRLGIGEMVTNTDLADDGSLATALGPGEAAVTIDLVRRPAGLEPGDRVDVYGPPVGPPVSPPADDGASRDAEQGDAGPGDAARRYAEQGDAGAAEVSNPTGDRSATGSIGLLASGARIMDLDDVTVTLAVDDSRVVAVLSAADSGHLALVISR